ncbi:hypothetical protein LXL04_003664 [Taraxacum kok-saghyz]
MEAMRRQFFGGASSDHKAIPWVKWDEVCKKKVFCGSKLETGNIRHSGGTSLSWKWKRLPRARREDLESSQLVQLICRRKPLENGNGYSISHLSCCETISETQKHCLYKRIAFKEVWAKYSQWWNVYIPLGISGQEIQAWATAEIPDNCVREKKTDQDMIFVKVKEFSFSWLDSRAKKIVNWENWKLNPKIVLSKM